MRLIQYQCAEGTGVARVESHERVRPIRISGGVLALARLAIAGDQSLETVIAPLLADTTLDYQTLVDAGQLLSPVTHPDPAHCYVTGTGLTHLGSADTRSAMHGALAEDDDNLTDTMRMFRMGVEGGKPTRGSVGAQPEWFYKGDGSVVVAPEQAMTVPAFGQDAGEEPELVGIYLNDDDGNPWRLGYAIGNELSDHVTERQNYLWLAHSKLRQCSVGPELLVGELPEHLAGTSRIVRDGKTLWEAGFVTGEANMSHALANLEHHHFKYALFRRPGDLHLHFFGTATLSFADRITTQDGDRFEVELPALGRALRNPLTIAPADSSGAVRSLGAAQPAPCSPEPAPTCSTKGDTMRIEGVQLIGREAVRGTKAIIQAINPATGEHLEPGWPGGTRADVERACALAEKAFDDWRESRPETRARFLETVADEIEALGDALIERAMAESGLPAARLNGERGRTCGQLRLFARVVRDGEWLDVRIDPALPERTPLPRADLRQRQVALGPVAVFGASNFPLAFSVAGGDTASALAAGCPVIVKAHSAHPGTSELVGRAIQRAVERCELPEGVFSLLVGAGREVGQALVADPRICAAGFTGSRQGGQALLAIARSRPEPIPFYAEMSSINPVFLLPEALEARAETIAEGFVASLNMGAGQFCTNPGLVIANRGAALERFTHAAGEALAGLEAHTMLTPGICDAYRTGVERLASHPRVREIARGPEGGSHACRPALFVTTADDFLGDPALQEEVFGASSLIIECQGAEEMNRVASHLEGQLTATLQMDEGDADTARRLLPMLERRAGRVMANGWPTGVEVCDAMVHGGPWPATSDARTTSVGTRAIERFLRPVCYQDIPDSLLPEAVREGNPLSLSRLVDGKRER